MPQQILLFLCQVVIRTMDREVIFLALHDKVFQPFPHHLTFPANHGSLVDRQTFIGHHQILIDAQHLTEPLTSRTSAQRIIKAKHHIGRLLEYHAIRLELLRKFLHDYPFLRINTDQTGTMALKESGLGRVCQTAFQGLIVRYRQAVHQQLDRVRQQLLTGQYLRDTIYRIIHRQTGISFFPQDLQLLLHIPAFRQDNRGEYGKTSPFGISHDLLDNIAHLMFFHLGAGNWRYRLPDASI